MNADEDEEMPPQVENVETEDDPMNVNANDSGTEDSSHCHGINGVGEAI
jgi:hypothetical protein